MRLPDLQVQHPTPIPATRLVAWPEETPLREKLYGNLVALSEEDGVVRASHWRGCLEEAIEEEDPCYKYM